MNDLRSDLAGIRPWQDPRAILSPQPPDTPPIPNPTGPPPPGPGQ